MSARASQARVLLCPRNNFILFAAFCSFVLAFYSFLFFLFFFFGFQCEKLQLQLHRFLASVNAASLRLHDPHSPLDPFALTAAADGISLVSPCRISLVVLALFSGRRSSSSSCCPATVVAAAERFMALVSPSPLSSRSVHFSLLVCLPSFYAMQLNSWQLFYVSPPSYLLPPPLSVSRRNCAQIGSAFYCCCCCCCSL